jgi:hypothetical protein
MEAQRYADHISEDLLTLDAVAADPELPITEAARSAGVVVDDLDRLYHEFHADALAASRGW